MYKIKRVRRKIFFAIIIFVLFGIFELDKQNNQFTTIKENRREQEITNIEEGYPINNVITETILSYAGEPSVIINENKPLFKQSEITTESYERYGEKDSLDRCSSAIACLSKDTLPREGEERGEIGSIKPTGWHTIKYDCIEDRYLYNRCHLIAWCLGAENANEYNLVTGTRYMNLNMTEHELKVLEYIRRTGNHVMYRATPIFYGTDLVCRGILLEGQSVEDDEILFCVFYYNVQPGINIDYATGQSSLK